MIINLEEEVRDGDIISFDIKSGKATLKHTKTFNVLRPISAVALLKMQGKWPEEKGKIT